MAWETNTAARQGATSNEPVTHVIAKSEGNEESFSYAPSTLLKDAVSRTASAMGFGTVLVKADGRTVEPNEGNTPISQFGSIEIMPKISGA